MNKLFFLVFTILISCNNKPINKIKYIDIKQKNGLIKHIGFYSDTKDTFSIIYTDKNDKIVNTSRIFYKNGVVKIKIDRVDNKKIINAYYDNGNIERSLIVNKYDNILGVEKYYYKTGEIKKINENLLYKDSIGILNNSRVFYKNGKINKDSTFFIKLITNKDTVSLNDSIKVTINLIRPEHMRAYGFIGSIDEYYNNFDFSKIDFLKKKTFYLNPTHLGKDSIKLVFDFVERNKREAKVRRTFHVVHFYVIK